MKLLLLCSFLVLLSTIGICCKANKIDNYVTHKFKTGNLDIRIKNNKVVLNIRKNDGGSLDFQLVTKFKSAASDTGLKIVKDCELLTTCILSGNVTLTKISADPDHETIKISRGIDDPNGEIADCFDFGEYEWFGGPQIRYQRWPVQPMYFIEEPYVPTHPQNMGVAERYWLSSKGFYVYIDDREPLFLDQNNHRDRALCLVAKNKAPYARREINLRYEVGVFGDPRLAHEHVAETHFDKPSGHPDERMVQHPIWSTWAKYKVNVNDSVVREFAKEIVDNGFTNSQFEIDDNWETCYGSANFDSKKFPNVKNLTEHLKQMGFRITLWIHPFINENCNDGDAYDYALKNNYFVKNLNGDVHMTWWQGANGAAAIDFTNPEAVKWWVGRVKKLEALGIDSFKFDAGEVSWLPQVPQLTGPTDLQPGIYTLNYTSTLAQNFDLLIEARVGWRSQGLPIFVRMLDKDTRWTWDNGLPTLITTLLQMNLNGYVFVLPDMIGGNGYANTESNIDPPSKELFIRWLQANVFMPSMQYSFVPWQYDQETIDISKKFTKLHIDTTPKIIELMEKAIKTGAPINPPIWWVDPLNVQAHKINDEYLLGESILVAPVIEENADTRDVYLPAGKWKDGNNDTVYAGPMWIKDYPAPLDTLPYFLKV